MNLQAHVNNNHNEVIGQIGWKYYNSIKKKAMEQEFSWSGLLLSLSIAFFIVIFAAMALNFLYQSLQTANLGFLNQDFSENIEVAPSNNIEKVKEIEIHPFLTA